MANEKSQQASGGKSGGEDQAKGQSKQHEVRHSDGRTLMVTQEQWRNRKSDPQLEGFERADADEAAGEGDAEGDASE